MRVSSLLQFGKWRGFVVPLDERCCYNYVDHLRVTSAPATRAKTFVGSVYLLCAVANSGVLDDILKSARLRGCAHEQLNTAKLRSQKDPLTVLQVAALEKYMVSLPPGVEACVPGHILFDLHSCARWSDTLPLSGEPVSDGVLVSAESKLTKTSRGLKRLRVPVPYLALSDAVSGYQWGKAWISAREACALSPDPSLQSVDNDWAFLHKHMSADEAKDHLIRFLAALGCPQNPGQNLGSHSLKTTILAWAARWPMKPSMRRLLGKHSDRKDHTMLVYSRDSCLAAMHHLANMIAEIREGAFDPDASRSVILRGRSVVQPLVAESDVEAPHPEVGVSEDSAEHVSPPPEDTVAETELEGEMASSSASSVSDDDIIVPDGTDDPNCVA
eukprot:6465204-Amphidinium_carterae.1